MVREKTGDISLEKYLKLLNLATILIEMDPIPDTIEGKFLIYIIDKIQAYEAIHFPSNGLNGEKLGKVIVDD